MNYETVIGLEVHVELSTKTKIFCGCTTEFGGAPNIHVCPGCAGMPGTLPLLNKKAVDLAILAGIGLNCQITKYNKFDRKNYFYPDLPKAYQISQLFLPICRSGYLDIEAAGETVRIRINEIHLEEDAGKLLHDSWEECTLVDYNRGGIALIEIVTLPDFRTADQVVAFLEKLREILMYLEISDCKMQEGSMRADVNLSLRHYGGELGIRTEMKNMNSFKAIHRAIEYEVKRQTEILTNKGVITQQTRRWDDNKGLSFPMRDKENAQDYRYFPDPDILPIEISDEWISDIKENMPELAEDKRRRYVNELNLSEYDAAVITSVKQLADLFEEINISCGNPKEASNTVIGDIMRLMKETGTLAEDLKIDPCKIGRIITMVTNGEINRTAARDVMDEVFKNNVDPEIYVQKNSLTMVNDDSLIYNTVERIIFENAKSVEDFKNGKDKAFAFLVGQTMKALSGKANPQTVTECLKNALKK